jgi:hypothetical protein
VVFPIDGTPSYELAASLLKEAIRIATLAGSGGVSMETLTHSAFGILVRGIRLASAVLVLIGKRLQGEAFILGRSLFEDSLIMAELAYDKLNRRSLLLRWQYDSLNEMENLYRAIGPSGLPEGNWVDMPGKITEHRRTLEHIAKRDGIRARKFAQLKEASKRYGRQHDYWTYLWAHEMVHGSDAAHVLYRKADPAVSGQPQSIYVATEIDHPHIATSCANWCVRSLLQTAGAACVIFGRDPSEPDEAFQLSNQLEEWLDEQTHGRKGVPQPAPPPRI